ncbi:MAG: polysaccharide export protein [Simkaniaceae bacterium]
MILFLIVFMISCSNPPYRGKDVLGAEEFVLDSYKIREGKFSILEMEGRPFITLPPDYLEEYKDVIQDGDVLQIALFHPVRNDIVNAVREIGQSVGFRVTNGCIVLPDLHAIKISGLTLEEARLKIQNEYLRHIQDMEVFLTYKDRLERKVELAGMVAVPSVPVDGKIRLFEVLAKAKVPVDANFFRSYLVREGHFVAVDMYRLMKEGDMSQNIVMQGGDKIYIASPSASTVMVMGEVGKAGLIDVPSGSMPLRDALAKAGGILFTGDKAYIQVFRGNILRPKIYTIHWQHIIRLPTDSLLLMPGDIVHVAATPITEWNRFISQLFPSFTAIDLFCRGYTGLITIK